jgi:2-polyprenyl-3-methyl-5-hydroxy-6-metoxy-1,4-benzoquinol methylase
MLRSLARRPRGRPLVPILHALTGGRVPPVPEATNGVAPDPDPDAGWFERHFHEAVDLLLEFVASAGLTLENQNVADIGCGDGIIDLGVALSGRPRRLIGYDVNATDVKLLRERAHRYAGIETLPPSLSFAVSEPERIAAADGEFDMVITWSAFEHVRDPEALLREMHRITRPGGVLFLQLWPFYYSSHGSHLWDWFPEPFHHLVQDDREIEAGMRESERHPASHAEYMLDEYRNLNRATLDDIHRALVAAGFSVRELELMSHRTMIPEGLDDVPLSWLGIAGVKLLAARL